MVLWSWDLLEDILKVIYIFRIFDIELILVFYLFEVKNELFFDFGKKIFVINIFAN